MKERPILMHARSINGILAGRKTQTRRITKGVPHWQHCGKDIMEWSLSGIYDDDDGQWWLDIQTEVDDCSHEKIRCPFGVPGDKLWVKETHWLHGWWVKIDGSWHFQYERNYGVRYQQPPETLSGFTLDRGWRKRPSIFMPSWASRLTLEVTGIRVERVQDISEEDAKAEGCQVDPILHADEPMERYSYVKRFQALWNETNGPGAWERNDWCWVVGFRRLNP